MLRLKFFLASDRFCFRGTHAELVQEVTTRQYDAAWRDLYDHVVIFLVNHFSLRTVDASVVTPL